MKINTEDAGTVLINRLKCINQALDDLTLEVSDVMTQREECCFPATNGVTENGSYITEDGEIITLDLTIP